MKGQGGKALRVARPSYATVSGDTTSLLLGKRARTNLSGKRSYHASFMQYNATNDTDSTAHAPTTPSWSVQKFFEGESRNKVDKDILHKIAKRAQLKIPEEKEDQMCKEMEQILRCVELIQEVDTQNVEPMISPLQARDVTLRLREDTLPVEGEASTVETGGIAEELLSRAPKRQGSFFAVPKVKDQQMH